MAEYFEKEKLCDWCLQTGPSYCDICVMNRHDLPAANVRPVVRGEWVQVMGKYDWMVKCSRCNGVPLETSNFCPNCGADMRKVT